ncbi:MAG: glycosyltransferase family 9 protein [Deltaproteobacteria bacterium]|nr:glycosyltransferase family 9 protein [Deltaproteobacteria bacterium]
MTPSLRAFAAGVWRAGRRAARGIAGVGAAATRSRPVELGRCRSVGVFFPHRLGDFVLAVPTLQALADAAATARLVLVVRPALSGIAHLAGSRWNVVATREGLAAREAARYLSQAAGPLDGFIDLTVDEHLEGARIARAGQYPMTAGFTTAGRGAGFGTRLGSARTPEQLWRVLGRAADHLAPGRDCRPPSLPVDAAARAGAAADLNRRCAAPADGRPLLGLAPGATYPSQQWPAEAFAAAGAALGARGKVFVFGSPAERELVQEIARRAGATPVWDLPLGRLPAALASVNLLVANNSGPLHLAAAVGTPTVSVMGPTDPVRFWPLGPRNRVLRLGLPCSPCGRGRCAPHPCLRGIPVEAVLEAVAETLVGIAGRELGEVVHG